MTTEPIAELSLQPGPQYDFGSTRADICVYGGAAGGGKSFAEILDVTRYFETPGFTAVFFRRTYPQLTDPDSLWDLSCRVFPSIGARANYGDLEWKLPRGGRIVMRHLQHEKDIHNHQGAQYCGIYFDELTQFTERQFWYMLSRNRSTCGVRPFVRASTNPDPDSFVERLIEWYLDEQGDPIPERCGVLRWFVKLNGNLIWADTADELTNTYPGEMPLSFTFIAARLDDNPALTKADPSYEARLRALPYVERVRLLGGNWKIRPAAGLYFKRHYFKVFDTIPGAIVASCRGWDKAATEVSAGNADPDWTRGVLLHKLKSGSEVDYIIEHVASLRGNPGEVDRLMVNTASQDGKSITQAAWRDPGQAGKVDEAHMRRVLDGYRVVFERASKSKEVYAGPVSSQAEGGRVGLMRGPWNEQFLSEAESFPEGRHDDIIDALSLAYLKVSGGSRRAAPASPEGRSRWRV